MNKQDAVKPFSTPIRPLSRDQFFSVREKVARDSPRLYREKVLSNPNQFSRFHSKTVPNTPISQVNDVSKNTTNSNKFNNISSFTDGTLNRNGKPPIRKADLFSSNCNEIKSGEKITVNNEILHENEEADALGVDQFGTFENPVLQKIINRSINKESEIQIISTNIIFLILYNLIVKFINLFLSNQTVKNSINTSSVINSLKNQKLFKSSTIYRRLASNLNWLTWSHFEHLFHLIIFYNVIVAIWKLFTTVRISDLNLSEKQRNLLGLDTQQTLIDENGNYHQGIGLSADIRKPHIVLTNKRASPLTASTASSSVPLTANSRVNSVPSTPYIFKSLQTPLKLKQLNEQQNKASTTVNYSANSIAHDMAPIAPAGNFVGNKLNAFGGNSSNLTSSITSANRTFSKPLNVNKGYIPSNKYTYMMNSPSPKEI